MRVSTISVSQQQTTTSTLTSTMALSVVSMLFLVAGLAPQFAISEPDHDAAKECYKTCPTGKDLELALYFEGDFKCAYDPYGGFYNMNIPCVVDCWVKHLQLEVPEDQKDCICNKYCREYENSQEFCEKLASGGITTDQCDGVCEGKYSYHGLNWCKEYNRDYLPKKYRY